MELTADEERLLGEVDSFLRAAIKESGVAPIRAGGIAMAAACGLAFELDEEALDMIDSILNELRGRAAARRALVERGVHPAFARRIAG